MKRKVRIALSVYISLMLTPYPAYDLDATPLTANLLMADVSPPSDVASSATADRIRTEYHPETGKEPTTSHFKEYHSSAQPQLASEPWWPFFNSEDDFIFSEILLEGRLNKGLSERLVKFIRRCADGKGSFTFASYADVECAWERASSKLTPVSLTVGAKATIG